MDSDMEADMSVKARVFWISYFVLIGAVIVALVR